MPDWTQSMTQTYEYYTVDPGTCKDVKRLDTITSSAITRDVNTATRGSASIDATEMFGESYVRIYLVTVQNGVTERTPLGTYLTQTPSSSFNGKYTSVSIDAYTPLIELKEKQPPLGYYTPKDANIMEEAYMLTRNNLRAPVVKGVSDATTSDDFVSNTDDTWLTYISDLVGNAKFYIDLDELGRVIYSPKQDTAAMQPVWTYNDDNSSILYDDVDLDHDLYGIPNVVEVVYSDSNVLLTASARNDDPNSPTSTISRGREIPARVTNPSMNGIPTQAMIDEYAVQYLRDASTLEYTVRYKHGYCPVRTGDCVRLNYTRYNLVDIKARVVTQDISCVSGCTVDETATFQMKLWKG